LSSVKNLVISTSGGETSGFMLGKLLDSDLSKYESITAVFANTGQENEATLVFVQKLSEFYGIEIVWLEAVVRHNERKASTYTIVDFNSASRNGEPFEDMIDKYGIPNNAYLHCTRELKNNPIRSWCIDKFDKDYEIAIGIRTDERQRLPKNNTYRTVYPLISKGFTKDDVLEFWSKQDFRLGIENYQGNCKWCWKKSLKKLKVIAVENPEYFDFPKRMEEEKGLCGNNKDGTQRVFFRGSKDSLFILNESCRDDFDAVKARQEIVESYNTALYEGGCSESCEAFTQESFDYGDNDE